jgi:molecular chaperone HscA
MWAAYSDRMNIPMVEMLLQAGADPKAINKAGESALDWALQRGDTKIAGMLKDGFASADADMAARKLREAKVEAERMVLATRSALAADGDLLPGAEREALEARLSALAAMDGDADAIDAAVKALAEATEGFAAERMNRSIARALTGRDVSQL